MTEWPNGAFAITFTAITVLLLGPLADRAYAAAMGFTLAIVVGTVLAAVIAFAVLPGVETFEGFSLAIGLYLMPVGALMAQPRLTVIFTAMTINFLPLLAPTNEMSYDTERFYNAALAIIAGSGVAALSFRLLPPLSPAFRTRRLLALTLRDLRRLAAGRVSWTTGDWEHRIFGRLAALPEAAEPLQRSQLMAALSVGTEIIQLRGNTALLATPLDLGAAFDTLARGESAIATARLARLDDRLASLGPAGPSAPLALAARASILAISDSLRQHGSYFDSGIS